MIVELVEILFSPNWKNLSRLRFMMLKIWTAVHGASSVKSRAPLQDPVLLAWVAVLHFSFINFFGLQKAGSDTTVHAAIKIKYAVRVYLVRLTLPD